MTPTAGTTETERSGGTIGAGAQRLLDRQPIQRCRLPRAL